MDAFSIEHAPPPKDLILITPSLSISLVAFVILSMDQYQSFKRVIYVQ